MRKPYSLSTCGVGLHYFVSFPLNTHYPDGILWMCNVLLGEALDFLSGAGLPWRDG